jgi:hypothetical protein
MRQIILKSFMVGMLMLLVNSLIAQPPPNPPDQGSSGDQTQGGPPGGNAPIGSGTLILLSLGALYIGQRALQNQNDKTVND